MVSYGSCTAASTRSTPQSTPSSALTPDSSRLPSKSLRQKSASQQISYVEVQRSAGTERFKDNDDQLSWKLVVKYMHHCTLEAQQYCQVPLHTLAPGTRGHVLKEPVASLSQCQEESTARRSLS